MITVVFKKIAACFFVLASAFLLTQNSPAGETFFCGLMGVVGAAAFLFVRPTVAMRERIHTISTWDLMMPVVLTVYIAAYDSIDLEVHIVRLFFMGIFLLGFGTGMRLIFRPGAGS